MHPEWVTRCQQIFILAEKKEWASAGLINSNHKLTFKGVEDTYMCVVWSDFWDEAWHKVRRRRWLVGQTRPGRV